MYEKGDIVLTPVPFTDLKESKQRPVLIISNTHYNDSSQDIVTCAITSNLKKTNYSIIIDDKDLVQGNLPLKSKIRVDKIFSLNKNIIKRRLGTVSKEIFDKVQKELYNLVN
jgi:mRNA interferase MazF